MESDRIHIIILYIMLSLEKKLLVRLLGLKNRIRSGT
jgi:hypothetical protein